MQLSECKVGMRVRTPDGRVGIVRFISSDVCPFPVEAFVTYEPSLFPPSELDPEQEIENCS